MMMRNLLFTVAVVATSLIAFTHKTYASHAKGADISYECLGNGQYRIVVSFYRDCSGIDEPTSVTAQIRSSVCTISPASVTLNKDNAYSLILNGQPVVGGDEVSDLCTSAIPQSSCNSSSSSLYPGSKIFFYTGIITLPDSCGNVTVGIAINARNEGINNIVDSDLQDLFVYTTINTSLPPGQCNDAPVFTSLPVPYYCINQPYSFSHGAVDVNGDSLVYSLVAPLDALNAPITYPAGYSASNPMPTANGFNFDTKTGNMTFTPTQLGTYTIAVRVSEYRNGVFVGNTTRDIQFAVINCNNTPPNVKDTLTQGSVTGGTVTGNSSIYVCPGSVLSLTIPAYDIDGQPLNVTSNIASALPGATITVNPINGRQDSVLINVSWLPTGIDTGIRYLTLFVSDGSCPIEGRYIATYELFIEPAVTVGPDKVYCVGGGPIVLTARGATNYNWSSTDGFISVNGSDSSIVTIVPTSTPATYIVKGDLINGCRDRDTVVITTANTFTVSVTASDSTICLNQSSELTANPSPASEGPFTYSWTPTATVLLPNAESTRVSPTVNTKYNLEVRSNDGCLIKDSINIYVQGRGPVVKISAYDNYVCPGSEVELFAQVINIETGLNSNPSDPCPNCTFPFPLPQVGASATVGSTATPFRSFYHDGRTQYLFRASELLAGGLSAGVITDIQFYVATKRSVVPFSNMQVKMGPTSLNQLPTNQFVTANMSTVYSGNYTTVANSWNTISLTNAYNWDEQQNLIIEICYDNTSFTQDDDIEYSIAFAGATTYAENDNSTGCTMAYEGNTNQRPNIRFVFGKPSLDGVSLQWQPSGLISNDTGLVTKVVVNQNQVYTLTATDSVCSGDGSIALFVDTNVLIGANGGLICLGDTAQLIARVLNPLTEVCQSSYSVVPAIFDFKTSATKTPIPFSQAATGNNRNAIVNLPFDFKFYCANYNRVYVNENGMVSFTSFTGSGAQNSFIPTPGGPQNFIAGIWDDLNANTASGGSGAIRSFLTGTAPNRCFVVEWDSVTILNQGTTVTFQIQMYESSNVIEVHTRPVVSSGTKTTGVELNDSVGFSAPGKNNEDFSIQFDEAWRFIPNIIGTTFLGFDWDPSTGLNTTIGDTVYASPTTSTNYVVAANFSNGCRTYDTVSVNFNSFPYTLSATKPILCEGESTVLSFTGAVTSIAWEPAATLSAPTSKVTSASPLQTTSYLVTATDTGGCLAIDSILIQVRNNGSASLGRDTTVCYYEGLVLSPTGGPYTSYQWVPGGQTTSSLPIEQSGSYFVRLNDGLCNFTSDTVNVTLVPKVVLAGVDTGVCQGGAALLRVEPGYTNYVWNTGDQSTTLSVNTQGDYSYAAIDQYGCLQYSDTINFKISNLPRVQASAAPNPFCTDSVSVLNAGFSDAGVIYIWQNTSTGTSDTGSVFSATEGGKYILEANNYGCINKDSIEITRLLTTRPDLGSDVNICACDTSFVLQDATQQQGVSYLWSTGATTPTITVTEQGVYTLTVVNSTGCPSADQISLTINCLTVEASAIDRSVATINDTLTLTAANESYQANFDYQWLPATYLTDSNTRETKAVSSVADSIVYTLVLRDLDNGCVATDTVAILFAAPGGYALPTAFSPNGDGNNDRFFPFLRSPEYTKVKNMKVYNRWGQVVFNCNDCNNALPSAGWDGSFDGEAQPVGTYLYAVEIEVPDEINVQLVNNVKLSGSFTLIK